MTALRIGVSAIEVDVMTTKDGHVIIRHDRRVDPELCSGGYAHRFWKNLTLRQVRRLDCGTRHVADRLASTQAPVPGAHVPTLGQLYRLGRSTGVRYVVEIKRDPTLPRETLGPRALAREVVAVIRRNRAVRRTTVQSFDWRVLRGVARIEPRLRLAALADPVTTYPGSPWLGGVRVRSQPFTAGLADAVERAGFDVLSPPAASVTPTLVASAHHRGLRLIPYTVDAPSTMRRLIRAGVDGLISNYPDRLRAAAVRSGRTVPAPGT